MAKKWLKANVNILVEINDRMPRERAIEVLKVKFEGINMSCNDANARMIVLPEMQCSDVEGEF